MPVERLLRLGPRARTVRDRPLSPFARRCQAARRRRRRISTVVDASRRNCVFLVTTRTGPTFVVKQAGARGAATLAHEAAVLRVLAARRSSARHVPAVVHHDPGAARLVLRTPAGARDWNEHHARPLRAHSGAEPRPGARRAARASGTARAAAARRRPRCGGCRCPSRRASCCSTSARERSDLVARVQASGAVCARLEELRDARTDDALVHGDLRWDNCLALPAPGLDAPDARAARRLGAGRPRRPGVRRRRPSSPSTCASGSARSRSSSLPIPAGSCRGRGIRCGACGPPSTPSGRRTVAAVHATRRSGGVVELTAVRLLQTAIEHAQGLSARRRRT